MIARRHSKWLQACIGCFKLSVCACDKSIFLNLFGLKSSYHLYAHHIDIRCFQHFDAFHRSLNSIRCVYVEKNKLHHSKYNRFTIAIFTKITITTNLQMDCDFVTVCMHGLHIKCYAMRFNTMNCQMYKRIHKMNGKELQQRISKWEKENSAVSW